MLMPNLMIITLGAALLLSATFFINYFHLKKVNRERYLKGLVSLKALRHLLTSIQQHRGLAMGYINGDKALLTRITPLKKNIDSQIRYIDTLELWQRENLTWLGILDHWGRLSTNFTEHDSKYNFTQHGNLIMNLLNLVEECAEAHHLQELVCSNNQEANFLWEQLLKVVEHIGQARAVGTSVAAAKQSTSVERIKLNYLQNGIKDFVGDSRHKVNTEKLLDLLDCINKQILIKTPTISASDYFNLATDVSEVILIKFDGYLDELKASDKVRS